MTNFAKTALTALALIAGGTAALATQGAKITAMGYGQTIHHAKMVTIQVWQQAAHQSYGYADWNTAYVNAVECYQNNYAPTTQKFTTLQREVIKTGGDINAPYSCIVSGYQEVKPYGGITSYKY